VLSSANAYGRRTRGRDCAVEHGRRAFKMRGSPPRQAPVSSPRATLKRSRVRFLTAAVRNTGKAQKNHRVPITQKCQGMRGVFLYSGSARRPGPVVVLTSGEYRDGHLFSTALPFCGTPNPGSVICSCSRDHERGKRYTTPTRTATPPAVTGCLLPVCISEPSTHLYAAGASWPHGASLYRRVLSFRWSEPVVDPVVTLVKHLLLAGR